MARESALSISVRNCKTPVKSNPLISKAQRRTEWLDTAQALVQKMRERKATIAAGEDPGPKLTIFGVANPDTHLGKTAVQKEMLKKLREHGVRAKNAFMHEEATDGMARSIRPFSFRSKKRPAISKTTVPRLGVSKAAILRATSAGKNAWLKRSAEESKKESQKRKLFMDDASVKAATWVKRIRYDATVSASDAISVPDWRIGATVPRAEVPIKTRAAQAVSVCSEAAHTPGALMITASLKATHDSLFRHRVWSVDPVLNAKLPLMLGDTYVMAPDQLDATMIVTNGEWSNQMKYGACSFISRVCGKTLAHMDCIVDPSSPKRPVQWKPLGASGRCTTLKLSFSDACK